MTAAATDDLSIISPAIGIAARVLFTLIFFLSGITHFTGMQTYIGTSCLPRFRGAPSG